MKNIEKRMAALTAATLVTAITFTAIDGLNKVEIVEQEDIATKARVIEETEVAEEVEFELTYYTSLPIENGGYTTTAIQTELKHGVIASNYYPIGTKIEINGYIFTVEDRGGSEFDSPHRLDVLVERKDGESDKEYYRRVNDMGRTQVIGKIL